MRGGTWSLLRKGRDERAALALCAIHPPFLFPLSGAGDGPPLCHPQTIPLGSFQRDLPGGPSSCRHSGCRPMDMTTIQYIVFAACWVIVLLYWMINAMSASESYAC